MNESFQNNRKIRTQITDEILLEKIWLDYTTKLERISKKNAELKPRRLPAKG